MLMMTHMRVIIDKTVVHNLIDVLDRIVSHQLVRPLTRAMQEAALSLIKELHDDLIALADAAQSSRDTGTGFEKLKRWKARAARRIADEINPIEGNNLAKKRKMSFRVGDPVGNLVDEAQMYEGFLFALRDEITAHPDDVLARAVATPSPKDEIVVEQPKGNGVFIVHGHDELNVYRLKDVLRDRYGLDPIVLSAKATKGRTLIEKFEGEALRATYAFVLLTPG
jgi:hypothetical protein